MKVTYRKKFLKELAKLPTSVREKVEAFVFEEALQLDMESILNKIELMKGYKGYFKMRFGKYRVGIQIEGDGIIFERILHRKDIYRYFP